jgi:hypothetical protein
MAAFILRAARFTCSPFLWSLTNLPEHRVLIDTYLVESTKKTFPPKKWQTFVTKVDEIFAAIGAWLSSGSVFASFPLERNIHQQLRLFGCCETHVASPPPCLWAKTFVLHVWQVLTQTTLFPLHARQSFCLTNLLMFLGVFDGLDQEFALRFSPESHNQFQHFAYLVATSFLQRLCLFLCGGTTEWFHEVPFIDGFKPTIRFDSQYLVWTTITLSGLVALQSFWNFDVESWLYSCDPQTNIPLKFCNQLWTVLQNQGSHWVDSGSRFQAKPMFILKAEIRCTGVLLVTGCKSL